MFSKNVFRAYDIRGIYPEEVNKPLVKEVTRVLSKDFFGEGKVVLGRDIRTGSEELYGEVLEELKQLGREVAEAGTITTPMLTFLINDLSAAGGIVITASHNPKEYNGIKALGEFGVPINGEEIYQKLAR
jgi:phosphomannomutase